MFSLSCISLFVFHSVLPAIIAQRDGLVRSPIKDPRHPLFHCLPYDHHCVLDHPTRGPGIVAVDNARYPSILLLYSSATIELLDAVSRYNPPSYSTPIFLDSYLRRCSSLLQILTYQVFESARQSQINTIFVVTHSHHCRQ